jgi:hypothetical protein
MKLEHFWYGLTDGDGYVFKRSPKVLGMLRDFSLRYLQGLPAKKNPVYSWLPTEQIVAVSTVSKAKDNARRDGVANHTVLIPIKDYISLTSLGVDLSFVVSDSNVLEPLEVKT